MAMPYLAERKNTLKVSLLGQCTTTWLAYNLTACALVNGRFLTIHDAEYDTVLQSLLEMEEKNTDFFVFLPWSQRILYQLRKNNDEPAAIINTEISFWKQVWTLAEQKGGRVIQIGYDYTGPGPLGFHCSAKSGGEINVIREMNRRLCDELPSGAFFVDLEIISGEMGRGTFYNPRQYYWTKQPFSEAGTAMLARRIDNAIQTIRTGQKKVLVLDLDNTLWGGVVGDLGPLEIELGEGPEGEAFRDFQGFCKELSRRGVLLAVASKNNEKDAKEPFMVNTDMVLKLDDIVSFHAHWRPKSESMKDIAAELNLGIDSLVFFDDNPAEREEVRQNSPDVSVVDVPDDPSDYIRALENSLFFETLTVTAADAERTRQYQVESKRKSFENSFTNLDDYLKSLEMIGKIAPISDGNMQRVVQLLAKTNQFNLTARRHDETTVRKLLYQPGAFGLTLELSDKFGDHGLIAVTICVPDIQPNVLLIDTFLMSCRVINRTAEYFLMNAVTAEALRNGFQTIVGEYVPTAKNGMVADLFPNLGFEAISDPKNRNVYSMKQPFSAAITFVQGG
jgi:FkbH-like protein